MFQLQLPDIFLSVNQYPMVSLGHVTNCIAEHILKQTASFKSQSFSLSVSAFYVNICLYVKTPVDPWVTPTVKNLTFVQCLGLLERGACIELVTTFVCTLVVFNIFIHPNPEHYKYCKWSRLHDLEPAGSSIFLAAVPKMFTATPCLVSILLK